MLGVQSQNAFDGGVAPYYENLQLRPVNQLMKSLGFKEKAQQAASI